MAGDTDNVAVWSEADVLIGSLTATNPTAGAAFLLYYGGELVRESLKKAHESHEVVPMWVIGWFMPVAAALVLIHSLNHTVIEISYLTAGRVAPEPEQAVG